jgi:uncharacterized protein YbaP (TraB family)
VKRLIIRASLGLLLLAACAQAEAPSAQRALLWKVSDADNSLYLLGSFHALKPEDYPLPPAVDAAFAEAESLAFEVSPAEMDSPGLAGKFRSAGALPAGKTLQTVVPPATWRRLERYCRDNGLDVATLQSQAPWYASIIVVLREIVRLGYDPKLGVDRHLMGRAAAAHKSSLGLETVQDQISAFASMPMAIQVQMLDETLDEAENQTGNLDSLHADWRRGDAKAIESVMVLQLRDSYPQLYQRINVDRNRAWVLKLGSMLDRHKRDDVLVVVGSMHLVGPDGLIKQLQAKGYTVQRL